MYSIVTMMLQAENDAGKVTKEEKDDERIENMNDDTTS